MTEIKYALKRALRVFVTRLSLITIICVTSTRAQADALIVSAASSLTNAFQDIAAAFEVQHPTVKVVLNFGASDLLLQQIIHGANVDIFASADEATMDKAIAAHVILPTTREVFATNTLVLITPADSPLTLTHLQDLNTAAVKRVTLGDPASVPAGRYTQRALQAAGLWDTVLAKAVLATNVRQSLDYVARGEVDAGFVFGTDAALMPQRVKVVLSVPTPIPIRYPIAQVIESAHRSEAQTFIAFVLSPAGQTLLAKYGFNKIVRSPNYLPYSIH